MRVGRWQRNKSEECPLIPVVFEQAKARAFEDGETAASQQDEACRIPELRRTIAQTSELVDVASVWGEPAKSLQLIVEDE